MQQVFNLLLLYFQLVHFYNNAEKKRKSFRGKTPAFFLGVFFKITQFFVCFFLFIARRGKQLEHFGQKVSKICKNLK